MAQRRRYHPPNTLKEEEGAFFPGEGLPSPGNQNRRRRSQGGGRSRGAGDRDPGEKRKELVGERLHLEKGKKQRPGRGTSANGEAGVLVTETHGVKTAKKELLSLPTEENALSS